MKVVLRNGNGRYLGITGPRPGQWAFYDDIGDATVFDLSPDRDAPGNVAWHPAMPFDTGDYGDCELMDGCSFVHVHVRVIEEDPT